jgi:predicted ATP-dependent serine protease
MPLKIFEDLLNLKKVNQGIISIWGDFGVGKTTLSLQILFQNSINDYKGIFIYSKPNYPVTQFNNIFGKQRQKIISNVLLIHCTDFDDLYYLIFNLEFYILQNAQNKEKQLKLILIDSITDLYRLKLNQEKKDRNFILNYKLNTILGNLTYLNEKYNVIIVIVNEISKKSINGEIIQVEAGGNVMDYWVRHSIKIEKTRKLNERKLITFNKLESLKNEFKLSIGVNGFF